MPSLLVGVLEQEKKLRDKKIRVKKISVKKLRFKNSRLKKFKMRGGELVAFWKLAGLWRCCTLLLFINGNEVIFLSLWLD